MQSADAFTSRRIFVMNLASNVGFFLVNTVLSLWFVPFLIGHLGVAVYGLVPLAVTISSYFNLFAAGLNAALGRFMTLAVSRDDVQETSRIFNSAFFVTLAIAGGVAVLGFFLSFFAGQWLSIPAGYEKQVLMLFLCTSFALALSIISGSFTTVSYCRNRFDLQNVGNVSGLLVKVLLVVVLFRFFQPSVSQVGYGIVFAAIVTLAISVRVSRYLVPDLKIDRREFSVPALKELMQTGGWIFVNQIGTILLINIDLVVVNKLFGALESGRYASVLQWSVLLRNFAMVAGGIFAPTIIHYFARQRLEDLVSYSKRAVKFMGLLMALPVGLICGFARPILHLWLGPDFVPLAPLMLILTGHLALNLAYMPLHSIFVATNKVKWPAVSQIISGVLNLALAITMAKSWGLYGVALAGALVFFTRNIVFTPIYAAYIIEKPKTTFIFEILPVIVLTVAVIIFSWAIASVWTLESWLKLVTAGASVGLLYAAVSWQVMFSKSEKKHFRSKIRAACARIPGARYTDVSLSLDKVPAGKEAV